MNSFFIKNLNYKIQCALQIEKSRLSESEIKRTLDKKSLDSLPSLLRKFLPKKEDKISFQEEISRKISEKLKKDKKFKEKEEEFKKEHDKYECYEYDCPINIEADNMEEFFLYHLANEIKEKKINVTISNSFNTEYLNFDLQYQIPDLISKLSEISREPKFDISGYIKCIDEISQNFSRIEEEYEIGENKEERLKEISSLINIANQYIKPVIENIEKTDKDQSITKNYSNDLKNFFGKLGNKKRISNDKIKEKINEITILILSDELDKVLKMLKDNDLIYFIKTVSKKDEIINFTIQQMILFQKENKEIRTTLENIALLNQFHRDLNFDVNNFIKILTEKKDSIDNENKEEKKMLEKLSKDLDIILKDLNSLVFQDNPSSPYIPFENNIYFIGIGILPLISSIVLMIKSFKESFKEFNIHNIILLFFNGLLMFLFYQLYQHKILSKSNKLLITGSILIILSNILSTYMLLFNKSIGLKYTFTGLSVLIAIIILFLSKQKQEYTIEEIQQTKL